MPFIKCISLSQPWADVMVYGPKRIENRTKSAKYRGELLIQAAVSKDRSDHAMKAWDDMMIVPPEIYVPEVRLLKMHIIGMAVMIDDISPIEALKRYPEQAPFIFGPRCYVWENVRALIKPIPQKGCLGLFGVDIEIRPEMFHPNGTD